jgi:hypothetical protein
MRNAALLALLVTATLLAAADEAANPAVLVPDMRGQVLSEFKFKPHAPEASTPAPFLVSGAAPPIQTASPVRADVITMAPFTVLDTDEMTRLSASIKQEKSAAHTAMMMDKLGVGIHVLPVGNLALFAGTVFYIPFVVGVGFSW